MRSTKFRSEIIKAIKNMSNKEIISVESTLPELGLYAFPKRTKVFLMQLRKSLFATNNTRELILIGHLFLENILEAIIKNKFKHPSKLTEFRFNNKLNILHASNFLSEQEFQNLKTINKIRNNYSHKLKYKISDNDCTQFTYFKDMKLRAFRSSENRQKYLCMLLRFCILWIAMDLADKYGFLYLLDY